MRPIKTLCWKERNFQHYPCTWSQFCSWPSQTNTNPLSFHHWNLTQALPWCRAKQTIILSKRGKIRMLLFPYNQELISVNRAVMSFALGHAVECGVINCASFFKYSCKQKQQQKKIRMNMTLGDERFCFFLLPLVFFFPLLSLIPFELGYKDL